MATLLKVLNNLADIKSAGGVAQLRVAGTARRFVERGSGESAKVSLECRRATAHMAKHSQITSP
jgi:hypothetical protein